MQANLVTPRALVTHNGGKLFIELAIYSPHACTPDIDQYYYYADLQLLLYQPKVCMCPIDHQQCMHFMPIIIIMYNIVVPYYAYNRATTLQLFGVISIITGIPSPCWQTSRPHSNFTTLSHRLRKEELA